MTDERLAEIENTIEFANKNGACEDIYADANWLLQALRTERAKVAELTNCNKGLTINDQLSWDRVLEANKEIESFKAKVVELQENNKKLRDDIAILNCMVFCGEQHSDKTETMVNDALGFESIK